MATYGNNRPALYKPTDFSSQQKRLPRFPDTTNPISNGDVNKKEEEKVTFKIQQRPILSTTTTTSSDQKPSLNNMDTNKCVKILTESTTTDVSVSGGGVAVDSKKAAAIPSFSTSDEKPGGVAQKDLDKINKLKEFMAKQQPGQKEADKVPTSATEGVTNGGEKVKDTTTTATLLPKSSDLPTTIKPAVPAATAATTKVVTTTSVKTFTTTKSTVVPTGKILNGEVPIGTGIPGILATKPPPPAPAKALKENKDPEVNKDDKLGKGRGYKEPLKDSRRGRGGGKGPGRNNNNNNNNTKGTVKSVPADGNKTTTGQNEKSPGPAKIEKTPETQNPKQNPKKGTNVNNNGTRQKNTGGKGVPNNNNNNNNNNNQRSGNEQHKNHNRAYDRSQMHNVNSYYSQANKLPPGFPNTDLPWLPYAMTSAMNLNNQSILGQPQGPRVDFNSKTTPNYEKNSDKNISNGHAGGPGGGHVSGPGTSQKKIVTVEATKDKSEQKKSLDFVKSFFDTDPEVQYNRKINAEKRSSAAAAAAIVSTAVVTVAKEEPAAVTRLSTTNQASSHFAGVHNSSDLSTHLSNPFNTTGDISNHMSSHNHFGSISDSHGGSPAAAAHVSGHLNNYTNLSHTNSRLVNNSLSNSQVNNQNYVHSSPHLTASHAMQGSPGGGHIQGSHIPGSSYSSVYHHSNLSNMAAHNPLQHHSPQSAHFQGSSTVSPVHMGASPNQLHAAAIGSHPSSLHPRQQTYDLYSQVNQINPLLTEPDRFIKYCNVMNANYPY